MKKKCKPLESKWFMLTWLTKLQTTANMSKYNTTADHVSWKQSVKDFFEKILQWSFTSKFNIFKDKVFTFWQKV